MTWREHTWEIAVGAFSWAVAIGALVFVVALVAADALRSRRRGKGIA